MGLIGRINRLANHLTPEVATVFSERGLTHGEFDVLATLRRSGGQCELSAGELAATTMVTGSAITKRVDRLQLRGLVERRASPDDGRGRTIRLTAAGRSLVDECVEAHLRNEQRLLTGLSDADREQLAGLLRRWLIALEADAPPPGASST